MCSFGSLPGLNGVLLSQIALVEIMMTPRNIKQSQQCSIGFLLHATKPKSKSALKDRVIKSL